MVKTGSTRYRSPYRHTNRVEQVPTLSLHFLSLKQFVICFVIIIFFMVMGRINTNFTSNLITTVKGQIQKEVDFETVSTQTQNVVERLRTFQ